MQLLLSKLNFAQYHVITFRVKYMYILRKYLITYLILMYDKYKATISISNVLKVRISPTNVFIHYIKAVLALKRAQ